LYTGLIIARAIHFLFKFVLWGLLANRAEWRMWQSNSESQDFIPVLSIWFWGLVIVQPRAERVTENDLSKSPVWQKYSDDEELSVPEQYGQWKGKIVLVDYAHLGAR